MIRKQEWLKHLYKLYEKDEAVLLADRMEERFRKFAERQKGDSWLSEKDSMLITYGDSLVKEDEAGILTLHRFMKHHVKDAINTIHILPMFPYTSDDGFSVVNYKEINPPLGDWKDIVELSKDYNLMFDAVVNHISQSSEWFQKYLKGEEPYRNFFITSDPNADYSKVTRPRALPLLTEFETADGKKFVWTTFSEDQIDLNFSCPEVLLEMLDVLLTYAENGARFIRLDAIGFLWKEMGTSCMHLPQAHEVIKLMRKVLEDYMPGTLLITETNVPYRDNMSYFGEGDEAHLIYQFPLPPLTIFSLLKGDASKLTTWAQGLDVPRKGTTYFNFLSSHDGIGVRPTEGILTKEEQQYLVDATLRNGGSVSYKNNGDGTQSPYELNINYQDALAGPEYSDKIRIKRFLAAETILLSLQGLPGIYIHSLLGSRNDYYGKAVSGIPRRINREKLSVEVLEERLTTGTNRQIIFDELIRRLNIRKQHKAFAPEASQKILT
ncbi:MAG: sugar phosphorylase, partial [Mobilitalea sp.]